MVWTPAEWMQWYRSGAMGSETKRTDLLQLLQWNWNADQYVYYMYLIFTKCINLYKYNIPIGKKYELCKQDFMNEYQLVFNCCHFCKNISKYLDITIVNECTSFIISNIYHHTHHSNFCVKCMLMKKCRN